MPDILRDIIVSRYVYSTKLTDDSEIYCFFIIDKMSVGPDEMLLRVTWNVFVNRMWPAGHSLETPVLNHAVPNLLMVGEGNYCLFY